MRRIYLEGIATGQATFQTDAPQWEDWDKSHLSDLRYVALTDDGNMAGWVALSPVSSRCVYAGVAEVSVYVSEEFRGKKVGQALLQHLITESEKANLWTLQAGIFPENEASVKLHEKLGFRIIGYRERVAKQYGVWRNVYLLERRSNAVGID
ncbi:N-acetyltransferase family protein [Mucilaginibacter sp. PAMB04274]|uniref:GNAT family N-acetyltransferase n=1 Tax=Mucilaginibacter sp. PAMB04274 TaxID=3138568 RepID=UPI0031F71C7C